MKKNTANLPTIGIVTGDPNGIGAEVVVKAWASRRLHAHCRPVVVGSASVIEHAIRLAGLPLETRASNDLNHLSDEPNVVNVLKSHPYPAQSVRFGTDSPQAGAAAGAWLDHADRLARTGALDGTVMGPISSAAMALGGALDSIAVHKPEPAYLVLRSGRLVIAHLTDHMPLREVSLAITEASVHALIVKFAQSLSRWGVGSGKVAVAGFNPHAAGQEESTQIRPAIERARAEKLNVEGPISPDSVFRQCIEGKYDAVIAMYHDQGHIALKTWGFSGNSVVFLGPPYVHTTVAHGVAFDLAGTGTADSSMMLHAILDAAHLSQGNGFFSE